MDRLIWMYRQFMSEPLWFRMWILSMLLIAIIFSNSSWTSSDGFSQSLAKMAAALFFFSYGIKFRSNIRISSVFVISGIVCVVLAWIRFNVG